MILFLIITLVLNFLCGFACLIFNFNFVYVVFMCLDVGVLAFLIPAYVTAKKEEKILEFWNNVGGMPSDLQKAILDEGDEVRCAGCGRSAPKYRMYGFDLDELRKSGELRCYCKKCCKKGLWK